MERSTPPRGPPRRVPTRAAPPTRPRPPPPPSPPASSGSPADVDLVLLRQERARQGSFDDCARRHVIPEDFRRIGFTLEPPRTDIGLRRHVDRFPFAPDDPARLPPALSLTHISAPTRPY